MIKPTGHKERDTVKSEVSRSYSDDGTAARTRPFSFDEIMLRRKMKKETGNVDDQRVETGVVLGEGDEDVSGRVESVRHGDDVRGSEDGSRETLKVSSRSKEDRYRMREDEIVDSEYEKRVSRDPVKLSSRTKEDKPQLREDKIEDSEHEKRVSRDPIRLSSRIKEDKPSLREDKIVESKYEQFISRDPVKISPRTKEDKPKVREDKIVESEYESRASREVVKVSSRVKGDQSKMREDKIVESEYELGAFREHVKASSRLKEDQFKVREDKIVESEYGQRTSRDPMKVSSRTKEDRSNLREDRVRETNRSNLREDRTRESKYEQYSFRDGSRTKEDKVKVREEKIGEREYEKHTSKDLAKVSSRAKEDKSKVREEKIGEREYGKHTFKDLAKVNSQAKEDKSKVREDKVVESGYDKHAFRDPVKVNLRTKEDKSVESEYERYASRDLVKVASRTKEEKFKVREHKIVESEYKQHASRDPAKVSSQAKEDKSKGKEEKIVGNEFKVRSNTQIRSQIVSNNVKDKRSDRGHEKRKNQDRATDEFDREHVKRHAKEPEVKDRDRENSEHVSKRKTQNGYDERGRDEDAGKKHESRKWHDSGTSENKQKGLTSESQSLREDLSMRSKRSRSREHERDSSKRSKSRSPRGPKQRLYDAREHEDLSSHSSKDRKKISNNGSSNKSKRLDASSSRLGGYSPRKRRSEAAVKTPSPTSRSPDKKSTVWDSPLVKMESNVLISNKTELSNRHEVSNAVLLNPSIPKPTFRVLSSIPLMMNASVDSVQLTQATRPKRRIYVENLPSSASEEAVMKWLSGYLRPYGVNQAQGTGPCISCIMNKDKGQALVEFLTPEDASTALHLDGKSFSGNNLRIRRPKDYVETTTGVLEKPAAGAVSVRNIVEDSPNKIFIGGISNVITSEMLKEIVSAFGPLKAYHFEDSVDLDSPCAFVEYADQSVTVKACVGLNGMKLGGQVLTVTQALPEASSVENHGGQPSYGTPVHARQLLKSPTQVLKLSNVLDPHSLSSLSELDLEEILEDIRLECARFGMVKSINIIRQPKIPTSPETSKVDEEANSMIDEVTEASGHHEKVEEPVDVNLCHDDKQDQSAPEGGNDEPEKVNEDAEGNGIDGNKHEDKMEEDETYDTTTVDSVIDNQNLEDNPNQTNSVIDHLKLKDKHTDDIQVEVKSPKAESPGIDDSSDSNDAFEAGCVLVEYKRTEASSMAAHCLHGRVFDGRMVNVEYVAYDVYCTRFHK